MSLTLRYFGRKASFQVCPSTGKVFLSVESADLLLPPHPPYEHSHPMTVQTFEFLFEKDSEELMSCLRQLAEIVQE
ncbi:hypothetical protein ACSI0N_001702 [Escherichia coli]|uniref:hypothetical protein n=1 Tax=Escherichia marmotae TaxID=1499973 RepID=UPI0020005EAA|nr:hypothetical protein [Escherichia marmotae]HAV9402821.1 hypothetical protein [Escherichia coli]HAV9943751.1 hypothetical protein [Escherichia coli]HAW0235024.1 hypothetical protein [Escherichia coli]HBB2303797.1 hypothetical protein [Escherichia coli]